MVRGRLLVLAYFLPPTTVGPAFVIQGLLSQLDLEGTWVIAGRSAAGGAARTDGIRGATVLRCDVPQRWPKRDRPVRIGRFGFLLRTRAIGNVLVGLWVGLLGARLIRRERLDAILVVYPKQHFLLAGLVASLIGRKPLIPYFMDVYVEGLERGRTIARMLERAVLRRAALVCGMSSPHVTHLKARGASVGRSDLPVIELPHPYLGERADSLPARLPGKPAILFSGAIYDAQADAIRRLIAALGAKELEDLDPQVHLYTPSDPEDLAAHGIYPGPRVRVLQADRATVVAAQRAADILFMPIAFDSKEAVRRTASPSKMPEYLAAGSPILVHAPSDAYVSRYAEERGFAEVVAAPDLTALARSIRRIATDCQRTAELLACSRDTLRRHDPFTVATQFHTAVKAALPEATVPPGRP